MTGLRAYQAAERAVPPPPAPSIAAAGRARLLDYGGSGRPVVVVPSLINPPHILDLAQENSLVRWLAGQGVRPLLVDWGTPAPEHRGEGFDSGCSVEGSDRQQRVAESEGNHSDDGAVGRDCDGDRSDSHL